MSIVWERGPLCGSSVTNIDSNPEGVGSAGLALMSFVPLA